MTHISQIMSDPAERFWGLQTPDLSMHQAKSIDAMQSLMRSLECSCAIAEAEKRRNIADPAEDSCDLVVRTIRDMLLPDLRKTISSISNTVEE
jgi:hypothetical protein